MNLFINGLEKKQFNVEAINIEQTNAIIVSAELAAYINNMQDELTKAKAVIATMPDDNLAPAAPAAPAEPVYEIVEAENLPYTIEQFKASKWTEQQLLDAGHLIKREVVQEAVAPAAPESAVPSAPAAPEAPSKAIVEGQFEVEGKLYMMSAKAAGASYEQFQGSGWEIAALVSEGYATQISGEKEAPAEETTYPFMNAAGDWEDSAGTIWDAAKHSMGSNKIPPVTTKGIFKKTRAKAKVVPSSPEPNDAGIPAAPGGALEGGIPAAPVAKEASGIPAAPGAATIDVVPDASTITDEPLDDELANIVKDWG